MATCNRSLKDPCRFLKGVGPRMAERLEKVGIESVGDLLLYAPRLYFDRSTVSQIRDVVAGQEACVRVQIESLQARPQFGRRGRGGVQASVVDDTGRLHVVWYTPWVQETLRPGLRVMLAGMVTERRGRLEMRQPEFERLDDDNHELVHGARIVPLYPLTQGISQKWLRALMRRSLDSHLECVQEILPPAVRGERPSRRWALDALHFPQSAEDRARAHARFVFEELFVLQLLLARRQRLTRSTPAALCTPRAGLVERYIAGLPFEMTGAQRRVWDEIRADLASGRWMQRLVQGDVGSGKTVLAACALLMAADAGYQAVLMAPTEALAQQHAERLLPAFSALGLRFDVLTGSRTETDKRRLRARLQSGDIDLVIGTHAVIQEGVSWARLGLAVVDEQQRFGVLQRGVLQQANWGGGDVRPHMLVLSATPIPRSLALALFGDLDISRLDEKPPGREPVRTNLVPPARRTDLYRFVRRELEAGRQAYVVLPLIEESDKLELRAATDEFERLRDGPLAGCNLALLHGRLPGRDKERLLRDFGGGRLQLLVSTTVIEVGIDVGNATIIILHHPDRFGLSQLHQLRGRVGRTPGVSHCFLLLEHGMSSEAEERLRAFARCDDGFAIAELDLELRGPGDFVGTRQHGLPTLRFADLRRDLASLEQARQAAWDLVSLDPELEQPEHLALRTFLETQRARDAALAEIG